MIPPIQFRPYFKPVIWGGQRIASYKGVDVPADNVGESWEISSVPDYVSEVADGPYKGKTLTELINLLGEDLVGSENFKRHGNVFPLLIKFIDASDDLSLQVHPGDELAERRHNCCGKTELWDVIETAPDAKMYVGLTHEITPEEYTRRIADKSIMDVIAVHDSKPGDVYFLPAGCIHAIGAGNLVVEIQQTSDVTYRIYDYERQDNTGAPRKLHTDLAREAIDYVPSSRYKSRITGELLVDCPYYIVHRLQLQNEVRKLPRNRDSFTVVVCLHGEAEITYPGGKMTLSQGSTVLFPSVMTDIKAGGEATILSIQS